MRDTPALLGRQDTLEQSMAALSSGGGVLVTGPAGIGKSALLDAVSGACADAGQLVLRSSSAATESWLPYLGLYDLFSEAVAAQPDVIPAHLRSAFDVVLLRSAPVDGASTDQLAIRVAVVEALRALSATRPVLLVLDDVNCLDSATAEVLAFAVRRRQGHRVRVLAAERLSEGQEPTWWGLLPEDGVEISLGRLAGPAISELLRTRLGLAPGDQTSQRIRDASGGNPFYALELGRATLRSGPVAQADEPLPVPERLRALLSDRLSALPAEAREALLLIATAARPPRELLAGHEWGLSQALASGIIVTGRDLEPRFSHPLLREIVYADADVEQRQLCHSRLAQYHDDPLERARHHALAMTGPSDELADELAEAARIAVKRGAPGTAAELYRLAAERTPAGNDGYQYPGFAYQNPASGTLAAWEADGLAVVGHGGAEAAGSSHARPGTADQARDHTALAASRLLDSARAAYDAGLPDQANAAAAAVLAGPSAAARVGARLLQVDLSDDVGAQAAMLDAAEADAVGDDALLARVSFYRAEYQFKIGLVEQAMTTLTHAEELASASGLHDLQVEAIALRASSEVLENPDKAIILLEEAEALAVRRDLTVPAIMVTKALIVWFLRRGDVPEAIAAANRLRTDVERAGRVRDLGDVLHLVASVHERAGLSRQAYEAAVLGSRLRAESGSAKVAALFLGAAAELSAGTAERAVEITDAALEAGTASGDTEFSGYVHGFRGRAEILLDRPAQAAHHLARSRTLLRAIGMSDPAAFMVDADLAESLTRCGSFAAADRVLDEATEAAERLDRDVVMLGLTRSRLFNLGLSMDARDAADRLRAALPSQHPYPLEIARAQLTLGELERRARRRAAARTAWEAAAEAYHAAGCQPWLRYAQTRLARLDTPTEVLSTTEQQIVELVRAGATNRQIAATLHVSVKAVEGNLTRLFRRFGVSSRAELAGGSSSRLSGV